MAFFVRNFQEEESLGEKLRTLRKHHNWSLREMAEKTKIQKKFLEALEAGHYQILPEPLYVKNYLKKYATALGGDEKYFLSRFEEECRTCDLIAPHRLPIKKTRASAFFAVHRLRKIFTGLLFLSALFIYLGWQINAMIAPPEIEIFTPKDNISVGSAAIEVRGQVKSGVEIFINNFRVLPNSQGQFSVPVTLERGLNIITVQAKTRHSKMATVYRRVVLKQE